MNQLEFLEKYWITYQKVCEQKKIGAGTKEAFIERNTPKNFKRDYLLDKTLKQPNLAEKKDIPYTNVVEILPLFSIKKGNEITITRAKFWDIIENAAQKGYELAIKERGTNEPLQSNS